MVKNGIEGVRTILGRVSILNNTIRRAEGFYEDFSGTRSLKFKTRTVIARGCLLAAICLTLLCPINAFAKRTVKGHITDKNGNPAASVRVKALDNDTWPNPDDLMGTAMTNSNGYYEIHYEGGHWDMAPHWWTIWRPDIFIRVSASVNGWCDDGDWDPGKNWIHLRDSGETSNHPHRNDLTKNLQLLNYPLDPVEVHTFQRGVDMWSEVDLIFFASAFGCAPNGDKVEWSECGIGGPPTIATRCWNPPKQKCTDEDYEKIRNIGHGPYPAEYVVNALNYLIESDEIDTNAERTLRGFLNEIQQYVKAGNISKAKETMESFKQKTVQELEKGSITSRASIVLLASADKFIDTH